MAELRSIVDREMDRAGLPSFSLDDVARRRDRKRRNRRIATAALALIIAVAAIGSLVHAFDLAERGQPAAPTIGPSNVAQLRAAWGVERGVSLTPVISNDTVYVGGAGLDAYPLSCGGAGTTCAPTWHADPGRAVAIPTVSDGVVYASEMGRSGRGPGRLLAYSISCGSGGRVCHPLWWAETGGVALPTVSPIVVDNTVYTATSHGVFAFDVHCGTGGESCRPTWTGTTPRAIPVATAELGGGLWVGTAFDWMLSEPLNQAQQNRYVGATGSGVFIFSNACSQSGGTCRPLSHQLSSAGVSAMSAGSEAIYVSSGPVTGLPASCVTDPNCRPVFDRQNLGASGAVAASHGSVFVRHSPGVIFALPETCVGSACRARWIGNIAGSGRTFSGGPIAVNDGLLFVGSGDTGEAFALPTDCSNPCHPVWSTVAGRGAAGVAVSGSSLIVGTDDGVHAFELGPPVAPPGSPGSTSTLLFYGAAIVVAAILLVGRLRSARRGASRKATA